ncbi:lysophospholipid acyltransferase family protein [Salinisphaera japonica]|uniref:Lipid A biosynthesis acyltransferase n=1 Tax=Salinisphaera japonica YTM-1 TaxID=1209778 RepID=A0A423PSB4_9GAMM|nr:lysophospholipid acyltransferase family protein [Salinisphaera japonica]ROO28452.1 lipid A biosynthesis acyltransferase [Salinisphaera japonica YTM-1]
MPRFYFSSQRSQDVSGWLARPMWLAEAAAIGLVVAVVRALPLRGALALGAWLGHVLGRFSPRIDKVRSNLRVVFSSADAPELDRLTRASFANVGVAFAELVNLRRIWRARRSRLEFNEMPGATTPTAERRTVFVTAHLGPWQMTPLIGPEYGMTIPVIYAPEQNPYVDRLLNRFRAVFDAPLVARDGGMRAFVRALRQGQSIGLTVDTRLDSGESVSFFGEPAMTNTMPARLALKFDCDLVPVLAERLPGGRFRVNIHPPITPADLQAPNDDQVLDMSRQINALFEREILARPEQWLCLKRRWPKQVYQHHA